MRRLRIASIAALALAACLGAAEAGRRVLDGYSLRQVALVRNPGRLDLTWSDGRSTEAQLRQIPLDIDADSSWFWKRPEPESQAAPEWAEKRRVEIDSTANYVWNAAAISSALVQSYLEANKGRLDEIFTFRAPFANPRPTYRLYPNIQSGFGFTNSVGWRSREIARDRPARAIRIAMLGDSTTNGYPAMVEHWLNLWSSEHHFGVAFEVINAARPGSSPLDAAAILEFELARADVDYVVIYGSGSETYLADSLVALPAGVERGKPLPASKVTAAPLTHALEVAAEWLASVSRKSAAAAYLRSRLQGQGGTDLSPEPAKPAGRVEFPRNIDEHRPDHDAIAASTAGGMMGLDAYLRALYKIDRIAKQRDLELFISTFRVVAFDGMLLSRSNPNEGALVYKSLNEQFWWPYTYAQIERLMGFYNRTLTTWAEAKGHHVIAVDQQMPRRAELYGDSMHELQAGEALHAWIVLQHLLPTIRRDLAKGKRPRPTPNQRDDDAGYWEIERQPVARALARGVATAATEPPEPADDISNSLSLSMIQTATPQAEITGGDVRVVKTSSEPAAYAAKILLDPSRAAQLVGRGWVGLRLKVVEGVIAVGILNKSGEKFLEQLTVNREPGLRDLYITLEDLSEVGSLMISNGRPPGQSVPSVVELHHLVLKRFQR